MNKTAKKAISKTAHGGAIGIPYGALIAYIFSTGNPTSEWWYSAIGSFLLCVVLFWLFRDEEFGNMEVLKLSVRTLLVALPVLCIFALIGQAIVVMFVCLGLFAVVYLMHLLIDVLDLEREEPKS